MTGDDRRRHESRLSTALVVVALAVLLVAAALIGRAVATSSAEFAATADLGPSRLGTATLDIELGTSSAGFEAANLAPGDRVSGILVVTNVGTLPARLGINGASTGGPLAEWLRFDFWTAAGGCEVGPPDLLASGVAVSTEPVVVVATGSDRVRLAPGDTAELCLGATLDLQSPNAVQGAEMVLELTVTAEHDLEATPTTEAGP